MMSPSGIEIDYGRLGYEHGLVNQNCQHTIPPEAQEEYANNFHMARNSLKGAQVSPLEEVDISDLREICQL